MKKQIKKDRTIMQFNLSPAKSILTYTVTASPHLKIVPKLPHFKNSIEALVALL
jgi:hypothetical protein